MKNRSVSLLVAVFLCLALLFLVGCRPVVGPEPATPEPVTEAPIEIVTSTPSAVETAAPVDASWERIKTSGKIIVGTSGDYSPFSYYSAQNQLDGFDIALMRQLGEHMGVQVEFVDYPFESLPAALQSGQIDAAIAALSITPQRQAVMDFSNSYFAGVDAVLARSDSPAAPKTIQDLAGNRVGVERGSVFQTVLEDNLVKTNLMAPDHLFVYTQVADAVQQLKENRVDLVMLDAIPAKIYLKQDGIKLAGEGLAAQQFGIAVSKGSTSLLDQINQALGKVGSDGTAAKIAKQYLNIDALPTVTPLPPVPTVPPPSCTRDMALVAQLTFDDGNRKIAPAVSPGQPFVKSWRVRNTGTCPWDTNTRLVFDHGIPPSARMGGDQLALPKTVAPGETIDLQLNLVAPLVPGLYQGFWKMQDGQGTTFGQNLWVYVQVLNQPTITPFPTRNPFPDLQLYADRTRITAGDPVTFRWQVTVPGQAYFYAVGEDWRYSPVSPQGTRVVYPSLNQTYELRLVTPDRQVKAQQVYIMVDPAQDAPEILGFWLDPAYSIQSGQCVDLSWQTIGQVNRVRLLKDGQLFYDKAPLRGSSRDCPAGPAQITYLLEASGPGGTSRMARSLTVYEQTPTAAPSPSPTPLIDPVFIRAFQVSPNQILVQQYVNISWDIVGPVTQLRLQRNNDVILDGGNQQNSVQDYLDTPGDYIYTLTVVNPVGQTDTRSDHVLVEPVLPTLSPVGPAIQSFTSSADVIDVDQCVTLAWQVQGDSITNITLTQNGTPIYNGVDASNQVQDCLSNPGRTLYRLSVTASGGVAEASVAVDVQIPILPTPEPPVFPTEEPTLEPPVYPTEEPTPESPVYPTEEPEEPTPETPTDSSAVLSPGRQLASLWSALFQLNIWH